nr:glycoside hydrolase family 3 N-terminal domain-containing protein [Paenibacillus phyllosphaerae]
MAASLVTGLLPAPYAVSAAPAASAVTKGSLVPYMRAQLPIEERVKDLLGRMTLEEKIGQMVQAERASVTPKDVRTYLLGSVLSGGGSFPNGKQADSTQEKWAALVDGYQAGALSTRLGIPILYGVDAIHGNSNLIGATLFPHNIGLGATRNEALVTQIGAATAKEVKAAGTNWAFAPTIADPQNIQWGRTYEGFGDDQELVASMGAAFVEGLQGDYESGELKSTDRVVATVKHYLGEGLTDGGVNQGNITGMTEEEVAALNLPMYEAAIKAGARTVMASYSSIQGIKMHANKRLLTDALKGTGEGQLGFTGFVISDYNAVQQITKDWDGKAVSGLKDQIRVAVNAGVDMMMMPTDWKATITYLKELVAEDKITQARIDDAVSRILRVKFESGAFEHPMTDPSLAADFGSDEHRALARQAVSESLVLLKNDEVNGEPILSQLEAMDDIFIAGKSADNIGLQSGGWSITWQGAAGKTTDGTTILEGIREKVGDSKDVTYNKHGRGAAGHDVAIVFVGEAPYAESNGDNLNKLVLDTEDQATLDNVKASGVPTIAVLVSGRPLMIGDRLSDWDGLIEAWLPGTEGDGVADVLFGERDFSGKLPVRWPFFTEAYTKSAAGTSNLEEKYVQFDYGYGLTKEEATPDLKPIPDKPGDQQPYERVEAEKFVAKSPGLQTENTSDTGGGQNIGYTAKDAWLEYYINVPTAGAYDIDFRYAGGEASITDSGMQILDANGSELGKLTGVGYTGGWQSWQTATVKGVALAAGVQKIKLVFTNGGLNFNWFGSAGFTPAVVDEGDTGGTITPQAPVEGGQGAVESWLSTERNSQNMRWYYAPQWQAGDEASQLTQQGDTDLTSVGEDADVTTIKINANKQYQSIMGMGSSMEESTVFNLTKLSAAKQEELLKKLMSDTEGIGMSMTRLTIGTADFTSRKFYSYDDMPAGETDVKLEHFSIQKDIDYGIIDVLKKIVAIKPDMKFFASPWSPPGWMKTTDSMIKGSVKDEYLPVLADYYVKFIQAYKEQGINISAMTLQNEPLLEIEYPSTKMPWQQEAELAKLLRKKLDAVGLNDVKLWIFDHNFNDAMSYPAPMLADPANQEAIDGTAFHDYAGEPTMMTELHDMYPDENIYLTERAVWGTTGADRIAQYFRNWARSYNSWVVMLDSDIASHQWVGTPDPTMVIKDSSNQDGYWLTPEYYMLGNFSKFVRPDYIRIDSNYGSKDKVTNVSFLSPDEKTIVSVVINQTNKSQTFKLVSDGTQIAGTIPAKSVLTYKWDRIIVEEEKEPVVLTVDPQTLLYDVNEQTVSLKLSGGTFNEAALADITLGGEAADLGITKGTVTLVNPGEANVQLLWDSEKPYETNTTLSFHVPVTAYADSTGGQTLVGTVNLIGAGHKQEPTDIMASAVTGNDYYQLSGVSVDGAGTANAKLTGFGTGDWAEFKLNVPAETTYAVTMKVASPNGGGFLLQDGAGNTLGSYVIPNLYGSTDFVGARLAVVLQEGVQTLRVQGSNGNFDLRELGFEIVTATRKGEGGVLIAEAESFIAAGQQVIQYGNERNNLGYTVGGSTFDYLISVPEDGWYKVRLQYATPQGGVSAVLLSDGTAKGSVSLPSTGGWGNYAQASFGVALKKGEQTIRIVDQGDGFNFDWFSLEPGTPEAVVTQAAAPVISAAATDYGAKLVTLTTNIEGAAIRYTLDGSLPTKDSALYTAPVAVTSGQVVRAIVTKNGMTDSYVAFYAAPDAEVAVTGIKLEPTELKLGKDETGELKAVFMPEIVSNDALTWTSSAPSVATVDERGQVTALAYGKTTITVKSEDGGHEATAVVTVKQSGGGGSYPYPTTPAEPTGPQQPEPTTGNGTITVEPITDSDGTATVQVTEAQLEAGVASSKDGKVALVVKPAAGTKQVKLSLPADELALNETTKTIQLDTGLAVLTIPADLLRSLDGTVAGTLELTVSAVDPASLPADVRQQLDGGVIYDFELAIDGKPVNSFGEHQVEVAIPYRLKAEEKPHQVVIYYVSDAGTLEVVKQSKYNPAMGTVDFTAEHFSTYAAASANVTFSDLEQAAWAQDSIEALAARGAINGTGNGLFDPNGEVTRAAFIKMLVDAFDLQDDTATAAFTDVQPGTWYAGAVASAQKLGIVKGKQYGSFGVNDRITREEMAVMIHRVGQHLKMDFEGSGQASFTDEAQIAPYAKEAAAAVQGAAIMTGMPDGSFAPKANATRAQAATVIFKLFARQ